MLFHATGAWGISILPAPPFQYGCRRFVAPSLLLPIPPLPLQIYILRYIKKKNLFWIHSCCSRSYGFRYDFFSFVSSKTKKSRCAHKILLTSFFRPLVVHFPCFLSGSSLGLCIEMSFWFYAREFAVNCYQLRIKFYNIHVSCYPTFYGFVEVQNRDTTLAFWLLLIRPENKSSRCKKINPKIKNKAAKRRAEIKRNNVYNTDRKISEHVNGWLVVIYLKAYGTCICICQLTFDHLSVPALISIKIGGLYGP